MQNFTQLSEDFTGSDVTQSYTDFENTSSKWILNNTTENLGNGVQNYPSIFDYPEYNTSLEMYPIHTLFFVVAGMLGNILALAVMMRKNMRTMSSSVFIATLAVADNMSLIGFTLGMSALVYSKHIISDSFCRFYFYLQSCGSMISAWTVVAMSFERVLIVTFPLKAPNWTSRTRVIICEVIIITSLLLHNIHFFWTALQNTQNLLCEYNFAKYVSFLQVWSIYDACVSSYVPLILIFFMNGIIIIQMKRARDIQKAMSNNQSGNQAKGNSMNATNQITIMLLSVSITFFICMIPYGIFQIYLNYVVDYPTLTLKAYARLALTNQICLLLWEVNHSVNFILYSLTGRKFRNELLSMITCGKYNTKPRSMTYASDTMQTTNMKNGSNGVTSMTSVSTVSTAM